LTVGTDVRNENGSVTAAATATAVTTTAVTTTAAATTVAATTTAAAAVAAAARSTWLHGTGFVHDETTTTDLLTIHAFNGSLGFGIAAISTKPKPLERPVSRSIMTLALETVPYWLKACSMSPSR
jgi:hypothetical protein